MSLNTQSRVLYSSPLSKPKFASFVIILLVVLVILSTSSIVNNIVAPTTTRSGIPIFLMALACSGFLCIIPITILWFLDRREQESNSNSQYGNSASGSFVPNITITRSLMLIALHLAIE